MLPQKANVPHGQPQDMMWGGPGGAGPQGAVSVLTTVYSGAATYNSGPTTQGYADSGQYGQNLPSSHVPPGTEYVTCNPPTKGYASQGNYGPMVQNDAYSNQGMYGASMNSRYPIPNNQAAQVAAHKAAHVAAAAVATATATAVAFNEQPSMQHQYPVNNSSQMPVGPYSSSISRQQYQQQPNVQYMGPRGMQPVGHGMVSNPQMVGNPYPGPGRGHPNQMPVRGYPPHQQLPGTMQGVAHRVPPPQYPGMRSNMVPGQRMAYAMHPNLMAQRMPQNMSPHGNNPMPYPQQQPQPMMRSNGMGGSVPPNYNPSHGGVMQSNGMSPSFQNPVDIKPVFVEEKMSLEIPNLSPVLQPFRLDHNNSVTDLPFFIPPDKYAQLALRGDFNGELELQLKCFHHDDRHQSVNWPQNQNQISVQVMVNNQAIRIERTNQPLFIKNFCLNGQNNLHIAVQQCCCSHFFILQYVRRVPVDSVVKNVIHNHKLDKARSLAKLQASVGKHSNSEVERTSETLSLKCPISQQRMVYPARGKKCAHLQCFDLRTFLLFYQEKQMWFCPLCSNRIDLDSLEVDDYVNEILLRNASNPNVEQVSVNHDMTDIPNNNTTKQEDISGYCTQPPAKRMKSEPGTVPYSSQPTLWHQQSMPAGAGNAFSPPAVGVNNSVLSPYYAYSQPSPTSRPVNGNGPGTPVQSRYGPLTPATPTAHNNPPSVGTLPMGPRSVEQNLSQPQTIQQQGSVENGSLAGSAPYTPASVGSAGSQPGAGGQSSSSGGGGNQNAEGSSDLDNLGFDIFGDGSQNENLSLLSETELMQYLDTSDLGSSSDFTLNQQSGMGVGAQGMTGSQAPQPQAPLPLPSSTSMDDLLSTLLDP